MKKKKRAAPLEGARHLCSMHLREFARCAPPLEAGVWCRVLGIWCLVFRVHKFGRRALHRSKLQSGFRMHGQGFFIDNLLVRIHVIIDMIWWTGQAP